MKKYLVILILPFIIGWAAPIIEPSTNAFCSCDSDLTFCWEITIDNETVTSSGGCSAGDVTATAISSADLAVSPTGKTGYSISIPTTADYYILDISSRDIISEVIGTLEFDVYIDIWVSSTPIIRIWYDANNYFDIRMQGTGTTDIEFKLRYVGQSTAVEATTTDSNSSEDSWVHVTAKWTQSDVNPNLSIQTDASSEIVNDTNLTVFASAPTALYVGNPGANAAVLYIKNIKAYQSWQ